jgi:hypothetical protein
VESRGKPLSGGLALLLLWRQAMTPPRRIVKDASYLLTRRCSERRFFLRPSKPLHHIFPLFVRFRD